MGVSLAADAAATAAPSPWTWAASTLANCGLAVYHAASEKTWPS